MHSDGTLESIVLNDTHNDIVEIGERRQVFKSSRKAKQGLSTFIIFV
jgi:hypothetical protein